MITINTEKGLIRFDSWDEMAARPGFTFSLDPKVHKFKSVIGNYVQKEFVHCGISTCKTQHGKGYIVTTENGSITRIGKDCGFKIFGVDFDNEARRFERDKTAAEDRDKLYSFTFHIEAVEEKVADLRGRPRGAQWIKPRLRALTTLEQGVPSPIVSKLGELARMRSTRVVQFRLLTAEERELAKIRLGRELRETETTEEDLITEVAGIEALYPENDLRRLLVLELEDELREFKELDIDSMLNVPLRRWAKWVDSVEGQIGRIEEAIEHGNRLLTVENLKPMMALLADYRSQKNFKAFLAGLVA